jgi:hypothetical protein
MKQLLYISYGVGPHQQEVTFSLLSALHWGGPESNDTRFLIFTDRPTDFADFPATVESIEAEQWRRWFGPTRFTHRCKILALQHALRKYPAPTVLLDGDTWFRKSPDYLFRRIAPGKTIMHIREGRISELAAPWHQEIVDIVSQHEFENFTGRKTRIPIRTDLWNAGVIGLDPADLDVLDEVLHLTDQFCARSNVHILEQFAFSYILAKRTQLHASHDIVFHYWRPYLRQPFRQKLPKIMRQCANLPLHDRIAWCYAHRPRPTLYRRGKVVIKHCLQGLGLLRGRLRST